MTAITSSPTEEPSNANGATVRPARTIPGHTLPRALVDVRGWKVVAADAREVGTVDGLMVELDGGVVRWVSIQLNEQVRSGAPEDKQSVMVPVGRVRHKSPQRTVALVAIDTDQLLKAPRVASGSPATRELEDATLETFSMATSHALPKGELYASPGFDINRGLMPAAMQSPP